MLSMNEMKFCDYICLNFKARWLPNLPPNLTVGKAAFFPHTLCFIWFSIKIFLTDAIVVDIVNICLRLELNF
jgi:hypothetical protein